MIYKELCGEKVSVLGMGNMRLPTKAVEGGGRGPIDREKAQEIIDYVYAQGVNYYDTAYMYHDGESEKFLGEAMKKFPRESFFLTTKFPGFMLKPGQHPREIFEEQLERCKTDYFDFYLFHNMNEGDIDLYMDENIGIAEYLEEQKKAGRIRHLGFSTHADKPETLEKFASWLKWEFAQIQLNYLDWKFTNSKRFYEILTEHGIPLIVMEPVRGGRLASLTPEGDAMLKTVKPEWSVASWAFRWLIGLDNVKLILSGMTQLQQAQDNIATFDNMAPLTGEQQATLEKARDMLLEQFAAPCTECRYCTGECPQELDIPELISIYNEYSVGRNRMRLNEIRNLPEGKRPSDCIACGACASHCPQSIDIPAIMKQMAEWTR